VITLTKAGTPLPEHKALNTPSLRHAVSPSLPHGYYQTIIPLPFFPDGSELEHLPGPAGLENLRTLAVCRLMLDNVPHVKAFWVATGLEVAQAALWFGADDLDGTVQEEKIYHMAGAETPESMTPREIERLIAAAGREPVQRDTLYNIVAAHA
jgi:aminodeoxyfutalosine synthase